MKKIIKKTKEGGYAILFTVVIVGIISSITIGLSNAAYKQMILSSVARDSSTAFYESDIASECALYTDNLNNMTALSTDIPECSSSSLSMPPPTIIGNTTTYNINPLVPSGTDKCFRVIVTKTEDATAVSTKIKSMGYNICDVVNIRTVERAVEVSY